MNKRCQLIVEMEKGGEVSVQINGTGADALVSLAILAADVCEVAKIPTAAFAMTLPMFEGMKRQLNNNRLKIDWDAVRKQMERGGGDAVSDKKRPPYTVCPECGSHLDPCETCDCKGKHLGEAGQDAAQSAAQLATRKPPRRSSPPGHDDTGDVKQWMNI